MKLGQKQMLTVVKTVDFGVYLGTDDDKVLLPKKQVPKDIEEGDPIEVFIYKDSSDRMIATTNTPKLTLGEVARLTVAETGRIGAFLDWGLEKDLLLPFKEQTKALEKGESILAALYIDKSQRLCATMKIYEYLQKDSPYEKEEEVEGTVYETGGDFGVFVAVDDKYSALIPKKEVHRRFMLGEKIKARITAVKEDGKLDLSLQDKIPEQMDKDAQQIMQWLEEHGGEIPFTDKADPEQIKQTFKMSKAAFKRGVGRLLRENKIKIHEKSIVIQKK